MNAYKYQEKKGFNKKHKDDASTEHGEDTASEEHIVTDYDTAPDGTGDEEAHDASAHVTADKQAENTTIGIAEKEKQNSTTLDGQGIELGSKPQTNDQDHANIAHSRTEEVK